ncbi:hypothetical protein [Endozoicomonas sp. Mp262]|uniref:hypothetical protein n=1 Tax=Endozoicomonas sp. Mp262 TaxID=2919499 RepID=UPI0021DB6AB1
MSKLSRFTERQVFREISRVHPITQKQLKALGRVRIKVFTPNNAVNNYALDVFIGTNEIAAHYYGKPRQMAKGVKTGRKFWQGAFTLPSKNNDKELVFKRTDNWEHKYVRSRRSGRWMWMGLPIKMQKNSIHQDAVAALNTLLPKLQERLNTLMQQELHYALGIE